MGLPLDAQQQKWDAMLAGHRHLFGLEPSYAAQRAAERFAEAGARQLLELGGGQGRDTLYFAHLGFRVQVLDYSQSGVQAIEDRAAEAGLSEAVSVLHHDVRQPLPYADSSFDGCYSHMLYCMALTTAQLERLSQEVRRVLRSGGLNVYTVRNTTDAHYQQGIRRGDDIYEVGGVAVHFFSRERIRQLTAGYQLLDLESFEEGELPRRLFLVTLQKV